MLVMFVMKVSCLLLSINHTYFFQLQFLGFSDLAFRMSVYNVTHTVPILTVNTSTKNVLNEIQVLSSIKLLHVSALGCHPQGVF